MKHLPFLPATLLAHLLPVLGAQYPYNPTTILTARNGSLAYIFSAASSSSQASLGLFNLSSNTSATTQPQTLLTTLPFLSSLQSTPYIPLADDGGITVFTGKCGGTADATELWRFAFDATGNNGTWSELKLAAESTTLAPNFLSAGAAFPAESNDVAPTLYIFGGMCPSGTAQTASTWVANANYSSKMLAFSPTSSTDASSAYGLSSTGIRAPPIPEAGLTMTPLTAAFSGSAQSSQQQNFVLIGGHTQDAFINMSQVAMFSLPQASWAFLPVSQPQGEGSTEDVIVEPRSGHTAVLTEDGTRIIVVGGWVGDVSTPAEPQVAILNIGEDYGGQGHWAWSVPSATSPFSAAAGIYGHGATLLQGGVMMIAGGTSISGGSSKAKRQSSTNIHFLNTTSMQWSTTYSHPSSPAGPNAQSNQASSTGLNTSEKIGIGAGLGVSFAVVAIIVSVWFWYSRRLREQRYLREKELRELALGAERAFDPALSGIPDQRYPERRSASWANMQEKTMGDGRSLPWNHEPAQAERTGVFMDVPSPTRGLRKNLQTRPQFVQYLLGGAPGSVFRIEEEEEHSQAGSLRKKRTPQQVVDRTSTYSDPFKDPPRTADSADDAAQQRKKEVQGWVEDWQSAAESILSRNPSQAQTNRTYSGLSQAYGGSHSHSNSNGSNLPSGRGSPEKSDRTGSNLSEKSAYSNMSFQRSVAGTVSRHQSQRSASAGQALFAGAAAKLRGPPQNDSAGSGVSREASKRSVSMREYFTGGRQVSREQTDPLPRSQNSHADAQAGERRALLGKLNTQVGHDGDRVTSPTTPVKDAKYTRSSSFTRTGAMALGLLGSVKRVITGNGNVSVHDRVAAFENKSGQTSPTKTDREESPKRPISPSQEFWKGKQGAQDWGGSSNPTGTIRRKPLPNQTAQHADADEWDVESAVNSRLVQVMFTVPKEKLRVVNADALSLLSSNRSDVDHEEDKEREREVERMSSLREAEEPNSPMKGKGVDYGLV